MTLDDLKSLIALTLREPRQAAHWLMAQGWPMQLRWMALLLAVSLSGVLAAISMYLFPPPADTPSMLPREPFMLAVMQFAAITLAGWLMASVGQMFGGRGQFPDALLLVTWIEVILLLVQTVQIVVGLILPGASVLIGILSIMLFLWLTVHFIKALHGFESTPKILIVMFATVFAVGFVLSFVAVSLGFMPQVAP
ncbi:Yip1 family protein [Paracoccus sp. (in: a-proteobacteria)]|uniref:Yip1 family protein n=1 Tax=Paracoccus sp. TaxID=267 RepID=UPI0026DEBA44|nr:Yip1 family protein [Paracoccus sp. (in: a-proteobacteria)]MDO5646670.1 Yip1 family protein [Paracoccus sp. (in: a-proteobacteria)]